MCRLLMLIQHR